MLKRIVVGILSLSVLGAGGAAALTQTLNQSQAAAVDPQVLAGQAVSQPQVQQSGVGEEQGQPWASEGEIVGLDEFGLRLRTGIGEEFYVELGPPEYWQGQTTQLQVGQIVQILGSTLDGMIHAYQVQFEDGQTMALRDETGQPLWSGGAENGQGQNGGAGDGEHTPDPQAQVDEWVTIQGTLMAYQNGYMTISTSEGDILSFKTGQPRFLASQGVVFQIGDEVSVVGFYEDTGEFMAGEITQISTGLRVMLRDPNGRPLWAGPGNSAGAGNGNGNSQSNY
jgi:hypothetical protein